MGDASVTSITEYLLTQPILSFTVSGAARLPASGDREDLSGEESGEEEDDTAVSAAVFDSRRDIVLLKLHCVHTRYVCFPSPVGRHFNVSFPGLGIKHHVVFPWPGYRTRAKLEKYAKGRHCHTTTMLLFFYLKVNARTLGEV